MTRKDKSVFVTQLWMITMLSSYHFMEIQIDKVIHNLKRFCVGHFYYHLYHINGDMKEFVQKFQFFTCLFYDN
jgi:hypothetical protein